MAVTLQSFLGDATVKAMEGLIAAVERIPDNKRNWSPGGTARSALDQAAECAILGEGRLLVTRKWPEDFDFNVYLADKAALVAKGWPEVKSMLQQSTPKCVEAILAIKDEELDDTIQMPWGPFSVAQIAAYPYWNMSYHEGQCNAIAMQLGVME